MRCHVRSQHASYNAYDSTYQDGRQVHEMRLYPAALFSLASPVIERGKSLWPGARAGLQWSDEGQFRLGDRASYGLAGCRCLT
jgi:hypothetical protein